MSFALARRGRVLLRCVSLVEGSSPGARVALANTPAYRSIGSIRNLSATSSSSLFRRPLPILAKNTYATAAGQTKTSTTSKSTGKQAKKAAKKPAKKTAKAKPKAKSAPKRKQLTEKQKEAKEKKQARENIQNLKAIALDPPKGLPETAYILLQQQHKAFGSVSEAYKNLDPAERQRLDQIAEQNKAANKTAYQQWVLRHTPLQIKEANAARRRLRKLLNKKRGFMELSDDRQLKRPGNAYMFFVKEVSARGDVSTSDRMVKSAEMWKGLSAGEKERYQQLALEEKDKYAKEYRALYGKEPPKCIRITNPGVTSNPP
ncbi:hypothetical protein AJ79_02361 [Helicocarpus griseus UAMH5409]|uniref:HMG box domain-containing protein n=1 Tax=Helicocarpus griseus UAMH5409 TaxID=1447875 RepID=A0A2B7Y365_9EURO|nr:hypothetical protein AJ79_02361 [Helicocarpus griseus UAMH5409]